MTCREADGEVSSSSPVCIMFDKEEVPATRLQRGVYRCNAPPHEAGTISLSITWGNGSPCSNTQPFTYRVTPQTARTQVSPLTHGILAPSMEISHQGFLACSPHRRCGHCHVCKSDNSICQMPRACATGEHARVSMPIMQRTSCMLRTQDLEMCCAQDDLARAAIPDRDLQLRLIHMLMAERSSTPGATQSPSTSSDSGNRSRVHSGSSVSPVSEDVVSVLAIIDHRNLAVHLNLQWSMTPCIKGCSLVTQPDYILQLSRIFLKKAL